MSTTQAHAEQMERTAARFEDVNQSLSAMLRRLMGELDGLRAQWQGAGGRTFDETRRAWADGQDRLHRALAETSTAIRTAGRQYTASDADAAARMRTAGGTVPLPL